MGRRGGEAVGRIRWTEAVSLRPPPGQSLLFNHPAESSDEKFKNKLQEKSTETSSDLVQKQ